MTNLFISLLIYSQNFIFSIISKSEFYISIYEFLAIYSVVLLISKIQRFKNIIFAIIQVLYFIHFSFINYFGRDITKSDMYLFFTHQDETYDSLLDILYILTIPFTITLIVFIIVYWIRLKEVKIATSILTLATLVLLFLLPNNLSDKMMILIKESISLSTLKHNYIFKEEKNSLFPLSDSDINIVFVIGESLRAKEYLEINIKLFEEYKYKTIYSGATSTDVSIPLLLNGTNNPLDINLSNNLFKLAKQNRYTTTFISVQSEKSLQYIRPFLSLESVDSLKIIGSRDDKNLFEEFEKIDFNIKNFMVLHMQGSHSPYKYYENYIKEDTVTNYYKSTLYTNKVLNQVISHIKSLNKKTIFIFTSDHGEFIGLNGRYGHNTFENEVYKVPFVYFSNFDLNIDLKSINSHLDIYNLILWNMGYKSSQEATIKPIIINGTMITREDGFITIEN